MIKWIFFDIDNTLFDTRTLANRARHNAVKAMIKAGLPEKDPDIAYDKLLGVVEKFGSNHMNHFDELLKTYNMKSSKITASGIVAYHNTKFKYLKAYPNVALSLSKLGKKGYKLGIITNGRAVKQWDKLIRLGLSEHFSLVIISEEIGIEKPDKGIFNEAMKKAKCKASEAVMVGDKDSDIQPAKELGMRTVCIGDFEADYNITKFNEILGIIDGIEGK